MQRHRLVPRNQIRCSAAYPDAKSAAALLPRNLYIKLASAFFLGISAVPATPPQPSPASQGREQKGALLMLGCVLLLPFRAAKGEVGRGWLATAHGSCIGAVPG